MELPVNAAPLSSINPIRKPKPNEVLSPTSCSFIGVKFRRRTMSTLSCTLPETVASIAIVATVAGAAATILARRSKVSEENKIQMKTCEDCGGSGLCSECNGEGFILKKLSDESAERARLNAKNMATRYTAALPKKWSYCTKCSSARSCKACDGTGKLSY